MARIRKGVTEDGLREFAERFFGARLSDRPAEPICATCADEPFTITYDATGLDALDKRSIWSTLRRAMAEGDRLMRQRGAQENRMMSHLQPVGREIHCDLCNALLGFQQDNGSIHAHVRMRKGQIRTYYGVRGIQCECGRQWVDINRPPA